MPCLFPKHEAGGFTLTHELIPAGALVEIESLARARMFGLARPRSVIVREPLLVHGLRGPSGEPWMSDQPREALDMADLARGTHGRVLLGGLGLGLLARMSAARADVTEVVVVEREAAVIELVAPVLPLDKVSVVRSCLFEYLHRLQSWRFDSAVFDIWYTTTAADYVNVVLPLRRLVASRFGEVDLRCWAEDEMAVSAGVA
jgi:hypothetical protein